MASPQTEDGYTPISNEIIEALMKVNFSAYESRVLWFIFRKTYGFKKKTDWITLSQFSKAIGLDRRLIHRAIKKLSSKKMIVIQRDDGIRLKYGFQKDYSKWKVSSKGMTVIHRDDKVSSKEMTEVSSKEIPTKDTITKDTTLKEKESTKEKEKSLIVKRFVSPTESEIQVFCFEKRITIDIPMFIDHYQSNGWLVGKNKMKDWKATVRNWARRDKVKNNKPELKARNFRQEYNIQSAKAFLERGEKP